MFLMSTSSPYQITLCMKTGRIPSDVVHLPTLSLKLTGGQCSTNTCSRNTCLMACTPCLPVNFPLHKSHLWPHLVISMSDHSYSLSTVSMLAFSVIAGLSQRSSQKLFSKITKVPLLTAALCNRHLIKKERYLSPSDSQQVLSE